LGDLLLAAFDLRHLIAEPRLLGGEIFDYLVQFALPLIQFSMSSLDCRLALFELFASLGPRGPVAVQRGQSLFQFRFAIRYRGLRVAQTRFLLGERLHADVRQLGGPSLKCRFAFDNRGLLRFQLLCTFVEILPLFFEPLLCVAELGVEIGFAGRELVGALVDLVPFALQAVSELSRVGTKLLDGMFKGDRATDCRVSMASRNKLQRQRLIWQPMRFARANHVRGVEPPLVGPWFVAVGHQSKSSAIRPLVRAANS
jgi:hypothetical protein